MNFKMTSYSEAQRENASRWKQATTTLPAAAKLAAPYIDKDGKPGSTPYRFCLPTDYADHNLLPDVRDKALALFADLDIPWHAGVGGGPSNHLLSSQVQCANALMAMVTDPGRIVRAFGDVLDIDEVVEIEPGRFLTFEYIGDHDYLGEAPGGVRRRGAHCTSVDAAFRYRTSSGRSELALIEWKYTESYERRRRADSAKDALRARRYRELYERESGPMRQAVPFDLMLDEPFYQLMRQQLLAHEIEHDPTCDIERARVLHVLSPANLAYQRSIVRPEMRELGGTVDELWAKIVKKSSRYLRVDPAVLLDPTITSTEYVARYYSDPAIMMREVKPVTVEDPEALLSRLKLGREEYLQRLVTMLIVGGPYPRWNTQSKPSAQGLAFLGELERISFGEVGPWEEPIFVDEFDLPRRHDDEAGGAPDWALVDRDRLWIIELKTERGSHRRGQLPTYFELARHHHPDLRLDLTYLTGPLATAEPAVPEGSKFAHLTWAEVAPVIADKWGGTHPAVVDQIRRVLDGLGEPWSAWRAEQLAHPATAEDEIEPIDEAVEQARSTAADHQQRALGVRAADLETLQHLRLEIQQRLDADTDPTLGHVRPWLWRPESGGTPMTAAGAEVGYEIRLSWYAQPR